MNPYRIKQNLNFSINELILDGENSLKNSEFIRYILPPAQSLEDPRNPNRNKQYDRYVKQGRFTNYPLIALSNALGLTNKGEASISVPLKMESIIEDANVEGSPIYAVQDEIIKDIFFYGSCIVRLVIPDDLDLNIPPKLDVVNAKKIIDFSTKIINNEEYFNWILIDETKNIFDEKTKNYQTVPLYRLLALDEFDSYYEAVIPQHAWNTFDIGHPLSNDSKIEVVYPEFYEGLNFVPAVGINANTINMRYRPAYLQDLIDLSLSIFSLDADLRMGLYMQSNPFLAIYGSDMDASSVCQGVYAVNIFSETGAKAEFVSPSCNGMQLQLETLNRLKEEAQNKVYDIIQSAGNASGDALALRINSGTTSLINIVKNVGNGIKRVLMLEAELMNENPYQVEYEPYIDFAKIQTGEDIKDDEMDKNDKENNEDKKNNENDEEKQEKQ